MLREILTDVIKEAGLWGAEQEVTFPVIIKKGTNDLGKEVVYYLNYSPESQDVPYKGNDGVELFSGETVTENTMITIEPWNLRIVER